MITEALMQMFAGFVHFLLGLLPNVTLPDWVGSVATAAGKVFGYAGSMGAWFPVPLLAVVVSAVTGAYLIGMSIKLARIVASFLTGGGGSAA